MKILIAGALGFMGREVKKLCEDGYKGAILAGGVDPFGEGENVFKSFSDVPEAMEIDCIVDFSHHSAVADVIACIEGKL